MSDSTDAGRNPAIELADDAISALTQQMDELLQILRLNGQDVDKGSDPFVTAIVVVMVFSSGC